MNPALASLNSPGGELAAAMAKTRLGAAQRSSMRALLLFARPWQIPLKWLKDQYELAQRPNFTDAALASLRSAVGVMGQREVLLDRLPQLQMPTLWYGGSRKGDTLHSGKRGDRLSRRLLKLHLQLRPPTPRRAAQAIRIDPRRVPQRATSLRVSRRLYSPSYR